VNKGAWDKLDEATRNIVRAVATMAERLGAAKSQQMSDWYIAQLAANGMQVNRASGQLRSDLESIGAKMTAEWLAKAGTDGRVIVEKFKAIQ
jgi:TRAP-type C4-dicarboxylate transport system substrate-binding protein